LAGQVLNDIKDIAPSFDWIRPSFSDVRNGLITIPYRLLWNIIGSKDQKRLESVFRQRNISVKDRNYLIWLFSDINARRTNNDYVRQLYESSWQSLTEVTDIVAQEPI
jgi:geranylgeranyl pyrophosphate synthase